jgi:Family of unknown function (DUF5320)
MPRGNQTGPEGQGPMTGRRMGTCTGNEQAESNFNFGFRGGFRGRRNAVFNSFRNRSNFFGRNYNNSQASNANLIETEINDLKKHLAFLEKELEKLK